MNTAMMITDINPALAGEEYDMREVFITIEDYLYAFYEKVGENAGGIKAEQVMADALFKLAGEASLNAMNENRFKKTKADKNR